MKKTIALLMLVSGSVFAQEQASSLTISQPVTAGVLSEQQATGSISAQNAVAPGATALYRAGQSVHLQPGFVARAGSVVTATVGPVVSPNRGIDGSGSSVRVYPNPFVEQTTVEYTVLQGGAIRQTLTDVNGRVLRQQTLEKTAGRHQTAVEGGGLPAGVYLYQLQVGNQTQTLRLIRK